MLLVSASAAAGGCSSQGAAADASADYRGVQPGPEAGGGDAEVEGGPAITTTLRLANMSPDLGQVDFCWRVAGASVFTGPVDVTPLDAGTDSGDAGVNEAGEEGGGEAGEAASDAAPDGAATDAPAETEADAAADGPSETTVDGAIDATLDAPEATEAGTDAATEDGGPVGPPVQVGFAAVSPQVQLPAAGTLELALVPPNQLSCGKPLFIGRVTLDAGKSYTVTILGLAAVDAGPSALSMAAFTDEVPGAQTALVRFIHAALGSVGSPPAPSLSVRIGQTVLAPEVDPASVTTSSTTPPVDSLGYASVSPLTNAAPFEIATLGDGATRVWDTGFLSPDVRAGSAHTGFLVSLPQDALGIVWCGDIASIASVSSCKLLTGR